jgi:hypothetical protein
MGAKKMKQRSIAYWTATVFVSCVIGISGILAITHAGLMMKALSHLGYPRYFSNLLGIGKLAGVFVLLAPGMPRLKEWAYVGCGITILSASYSHYFFRRRPDGVGTSGDLRGVGNFLYLSPSEQALRGSTAETSLLGPKNRNCKWLLE